MEYLYIALGILSLSALGYAFYLGRKHEKGNQQTEKLDAIEKSKSIEIKNDGLSAGDIHSKLGKWVRPE